MEYYYLASKQKKKQIDIFRLEKKKGIIWCEDAFSLLRNDKNIPSYIKEKLDKEALILFKDGIRISK